MAVYSVLPPFLVFPDSDGTPLENGQIFIGQPGFEARSTPKASFFDTAQTIPTGTATGAAIRTMGGFPARNGSPAMFYVDGDFSISVLDRNGVLLYSALNTTLAINLGAITTGPILAPDGNIVAVGLGFISEANTGWIRSSAGTVQYIVQGAVVAQMTATGVTFNQTVGGAGFSSGVLALAQPLDANLTELATPGAIGTLKVSDGANYDNITPGTTGQVLTGVTGDKPTFQTPPAPGTQRVVSSLVALSSTTSSAGTFSGGNMPANMKACGFFLYGGTYSAARAGIRVRIGNSGSFISAGYVASSEGASATTEFIVRHATATAGGVTAKGRLDFAGDANDDVVFDGSVAQTTTPSNGTGGGYITAASHGITVDRLQVTIESGSAWSAGSCYFWYEV